MLGAIRVILIVSFWGGLFGVILESPVMLFVSRLACGLSIRMFAVRGRHAGLALGAAAFALLMTAELVLSLVAFGRSPAGYLRAYRTPAGAVGLASQIAFGLIPLLRSGGFRRA